MLQHAEDASEADNQASCRTSETRKIERIDSFGELLALYLEEEQMAKRQDDLDKDGMSCSSNVSSRHSPYKPESESESKAYLGVRKSDDMEFLDCRERAYVDCGSKEVAKSELDDVGRVSHVTKQVAKNKLEFLDEIEKPESGVVTEQNTRPLSRFEATSAEAELDMLLGSFNETELFDNPVNQPGTCASYMTGKIATHGVPTQHLLGRSAPAFPITTSLDDELDDLLAETSNPKNTDGIFQSTQVPSSSLSETTSKSKIQEDFDSWMDTI